MEDKAMVTIPEAGEFSAGVSTIGGLVPRTFEQLRLISKIIAAGGMVPKGMEKPETVFTAIQMGMEIGLSPMTAVRSIAVINMRPTVFGDAPLGLVKTHHDYEYIKETFSGSGDNMTATCEIKRRSEVIPSVATFSVEDAKIAGLWSKPGPWKQYPKRMLQMRARGFAMRDSFPDIFSGLSVAESREEAMDMHEENGVYSPVAETINKAIAATVPKGVDPATGEISNRDRYVRLRRTGLQQFVDENMAEIHEWPESDKAEIAAKWYAIVGEPLFPVTKTEPPIYSTEEPTALGLPEEPTRTELAEMVVCPDREGDKIFVDYCNEECQNRQGCPAFP